MNFNLAIVGFGVIGLEVVSKIFKSKVKKKIKILILEKDIKNIPGGVAYSQNTSKFGFFNNPLRLSNPEFIKWIKKNKNKKLLIKYIFDVNEDWLNDWIEINKDILLSNSKKLDEVYFPRLTYSLFLGEKLKEIINHNTHNKKNISLNFYNGELVNLAEGKNLECRTKKFSKKFSLIEKNNKIIIKKSNIKLKNFSTQKIIIGNGLLPPQSINKKREVKTSNYIWDFYSEGGTLNLVKKMRDKLKNSNLLKVIFIGNKAGLLETMPEMLKFTNYHRNIKLVSISPTLLSLEKAEVSKNFNKFKFKYLVRSNINKVKESKTILELLKKEFEFCQTKNFNKYDVWTWVLKKDIIKQCYSRLSEIEKKKYHDVIFTQIRNMTRYTFPATINAKNRLNELNILKFMKDKVLKINDTGKYVEVHTMKNKIIKADIVVNVSGPANLNSINEKINFVTSIKKLVKNFNERGFSANKNFCIGKNIYMPGILSNNFNPNRHTIIKAITQNAHKTSIEILKNI